jgi:inward rectifier potassium channel
MSSAPPGAGRVLLPDGRINLVRTGGRSGPLRDLYLFLLVSSWPRLLALFAAGYLAANALFAGLYLLDPGDITGAHRDSFRDAFFFSVQTMSTIGYGAMSPGTTWADALVTMESLAGLLGLAMATGLIFAKFSRPRACVVFSRVAVVSNRDGAPCLMFRVANERANHIAEARVRVVLARDSLTAEGERLRRLEDLSLLRADHPLFAFSWTVVHPIDERSPLHGETASSLAASDAELVVSLVGFDESFAQTVHARRSYVASEIVWGARFVDILSRLPDGRRLVDYTHFHEVEPVSPAAPGRLG